VLARSLFGDELIFSKSLPQEIYYLDSYARLIEALVYSAGVYFSGYLLAKVLHGDDYFLDFFFACVNFICQLMFSIFVIFIYLANA